MQAGVRLPLLAVQCPIAANGLLSRLRNRETAHLPPKVLLLSMRCHHKDESNSSKDYIEILCYGLSGQGWILISIFSRPASDVRKMSSANAAKVITE
jgi:hypothetical protein